MIIAFILGAVIGGLLMVFAMAAVACGRDAERAAQAERNWRNEDDFR